MLASLREWRVHASPATIDRTAACGGAQAMQSGRAAEEVRALRAALAAGAVEVGGRARCSVARGSVMPYKAWWANKVAI